MGYTYASVTLCRNVTLENQNPMIYMMAAQQHYDITGLTVRSTMSMILLFNESLTMIFMPVIWPLQL